MILSALASPFTGEPCLHQHLVVFHLDALQAIKSSITMLCFAGGGAACQGLGRLHCIQNYLALLETYFTCSSSSGTHFSHPTSATSLAISHHLPLHHSSHLAGCRGPCLQHAMMGLNSVANMQEETGRGQAGRGSPWSYHQRPSLRKAFCTFWTQACTSSASAAHSVFLSALGPSAQHACYAATSLLEKPWLPWKDGADSGPCIAYPDGKSAVKVLLRSAQASGWNAQ